MTTQEGDGLGITQLSTSPIDGSSLEGAQRSVILAGLAIYEAALHLRNANGITEAEANQTLRAPMVQLQTMLQRKLNEAKLPAIEKPKPSIIQVGHDKAADFLRAANSGASIEVAQFKD